MKLNPVIAGLGALVSGCSLGPNFESPQLFSPSSWFSGSAAPAETTSVVVQEPVDPAWWKNFHDPVLTSLEEEAARSNFDVRLATVRLQESRAERGQTAADQYPNADTNGSYVREKIADRGVIGLLAGGSSSTPGTSANGLTGTNGGIPTTVTSQASGKSHVPSFNLFQSGFDSTWELDFWGRVRREVEAADATLLASAESRRNSLVTVLAEVARDYLQVRGEQRDLQIVRDTLASERDSLRITQERASGGLTTGLDVANAAAQVGTTAAQIPMLENGITTNINAIAFLLGKTPGSLADELGPPRAVPPVPPVVPVGLPSELTERRPDVQQAEAQLHSATADIGEAEAEFFPKVTLSGSVSVQATQFKNLGNFGAYGALQYSAGPSVTIPVFEGGRLKFQLELRKAQQQEAAVQYQQVVLQAFHDVNNALTAYSSEQVRRDQLSYAVDQARHALTIARQQYVQGLSTFLDVLTAQRTALDLEQQYADSTTNVSTNLVQLYKALGGGWEETFPRGSPAEAAPKLVSLK